ncbi:elongator complex protein 4 [Apiospora arundinis]
MVDGTPGRPASSEPPCYNCGLRGHLFTACPEPTRELPAGLEASRARQHSSASDRNDLDRKHKGPIVTRYSHPGGHNQGQGQGANPYGPPPPQQYSYGPPHSATYPSPYPQSFPQGYPPPPRPPFDGYGAPGTAGSPPGPPPGAHPAPPPGFHPGHPGSHPQSYGHPPYGQPPLAQYHKISPLPPPGLPLPPPPPPHGHPLPPHPPPIHFSSDNRGFPGPVPPPGFPSYPPGYPPPQHEEQYPSFPHPRREHHRDDRYGKNERGGRRGGHYNARDQDRPRFERDRPYREHSRDRDHRGRTDRHGAKRRFHDRNMDHSPRGGNTSHQLPLSRSESVQSKNPRSTSLSRQESLHTSNQSTPGHSSTLDQSQPSKQPEDVPSQDKAPAGEIQAETKVPAETESAEPESKTTPVVNTNFQANAESQAKDPAVEPPTPQVHPAEQSSQQPGDDADSPYEGFRHDEQTIFNEFEAANKGDPIAEPLPAEWTDGIMLPPPYNAPSVKSAYITPENKDDFALGVRDTEQWAQYRHHIAFQDPKNITIESIDIYLAQIKKLQERPEKRNRAGQHANSQRAKPQNRDHHQGQHNHKDQNRKPDNRKRRWEDYQGEIGAGASRHDPTDALSNYNHGYDSKRSKQMSPEPGEVSDSGSVHGGGIVDVNKRPAAAESAWTGWTRGPADIAPPRDHPLPDRPTAVETPWYPEAASAHYQAQPPPRRYHTEGTSLDEDMGEITVTMATNIETPPESRKESRGRSRSPSARRHFSGRPHSPLGVSSPHQDGTPNSKPRMRNDSVVSSSAGPEGGRSREVLPSSEKQPYQQRRESSVSRVAGRPGSRQSTPGNASEPESPGSPLTPLEAELLGLVGPDSSDSDTGAKSPSPKRKPQRRLPKMKKRRAQVDAAYSSLYSSRRW